jgi:hypothetical protein
MKKKGDSLEIFVEHLFRDLGKKKVRRNIHRTKGIRAQIDVVFGLWPFETYVECKNKGNSYRVTYEEYSKFVKVCNHHKIRRRVMVTNSSYERRCQQDSIKDRVELIDGHQLHKLFRKSKFYVSKKHSLTNLIQKHGKYPYQQSLKRRATNYSKYGLIFAAAVFTYEHRDSWLPLVENLF